VKETVVVASEFTPGDHRLVAYLVPDRDPAPAVAELRRDLREHLPDFMIPAVFVNLDSLPRTPNNKIDRRALPAPQLTRPELEQSCIASRTPLEATVTEIWSDVLGIRPIGVFDNFFHLGGHSLLATRVVSRIRDAVGRDIPLRLLFECPTVAELAAGIETTEKGRSILPPIQPLPRKKYRTIPREKSGPHE